MCLNGILVLQDVLNFDAFLSPHADDSIKSGIRAVYSMTFSIRDASWWNMVHPDQLMSDEESVYNFVYKLSM